MAKMLYQGHGSLRLTSDKGTVIYIDPFAGEGYDLPADGILASHEHPDHNQIDKCAKKEGVAVYRAADLLVNGEYKTVTIGDVVIKAVPAGNNPNHPIDQCVGFVFEVDGVKVYCAGDTSKTDYMKEELSKMELDYAFLPIDGKFNMGPEEAIECANDIGAKHTVPIHMAPGKMFDEEAAKKLAVPSLLIVPDGTVIDL